MVERRVEKGVTRGKPFEIDVDGEKIIAYEGETISAALIAAGRRTFRHTTKKNHPRGMFCGIGLCHECLMVINGVPNTRACQTLATPGCRVESQEGLGRLEVEN
jgi:sarcosine oxidase subunit alpha